MSSKSKDTKYNKNMLWKKNGSKYANICNIKILLLYSYLKLLFLKEKNM